MHYKNGREAKNGDTVIGKVTALAKKAPLVILAAALFLCSFVVPSQAQTTITTGTNGVATTNVLSDLGVSGSLANLWNAIDASDILQATNWAVAPYLTYAPSAADHVGAGVLAIYNMPQLSSSLGQVGAALGADWLGSWSLVSGNVTLQVPTHPLANISWLSFLPASIKGATMVPFAVAGIGTPMSGSGSEATLWDVGDQVKFGHWLGGSFGAGVSWGEWMNAGRESGHRYHFFLSYQKGF